MLRVLRDLRNKTPKGTDETNQRNSRPSQDMSIQSEPKDDEASVEGTVEPDIRPQRQVPKFIILHYSPFKAVWDWIILLLVLYTAVFTPYMAAFLLNEDETRMKLNMDAATRLRNSESVKADPLVLVDLVVDVMFIVDILINFRTTYVKDGEVITDPLMIAKNYLKGWFLIDTLAAVPFDLLLFGSGTSDTMTITGSMKTARLLRLLRVARRMNQYSQYGSAVLILMMVIFALIAHWLACVFYAIAYVERPHLEFPISWLDSLAAKMEMPYIVNDTTSGPDIRSKYVTAMYFTLTTLTSIGFGNVAPNTNAEKIFSIIAMMIGSLMSAVVFGNVSSIMLRVYQGTEEFHERSESIKEFILFHSIPKTLADRLQDSFQHSWSYTNGIDMNQVLKSFPDCLQADICLHLNRNLLSNSVAFRGASPGCLRALSLKFRTTHAPPGDTLIHPGDILTAIYFIARGTIEVVGKTDEVLAILGKDDIFGQNADDLASVSKSNYSVRALTYCDLNKIELDDLEEILDTYPEFAKSFKKKFTITFNLRKPHEDTGDFQQRTTPNKMDEETLKFIRQKQPKLQFKKSSSYDSESPFEKEYEPKHQQKSSVTRQAQQPRVPDNLKRRGTVDMSSDEEDAEIVELSPEKATSTYEPDVLLRRKNSMNSIAGALSSVISAVSGQRKKGPQAMQTRSFYPKSTHLQRGASVFSDAVIQPQQPSPLELNELPSPRAAEVQYLQPPLTTSASASSSSSHIPKSCSNTTGPLSGHSPVEYDVVHGHPEKCSIRSFSDIDIRLEAINERMNNFENNLCTTVDAILEILGHKPQIIREQFLQRTTRPKVLFSDSLLTAAPSSSVGTGTPSSASEVTVAQRSPSDCIMTIPHLVKSPSETSGILKRY